MTLLSPSSNEVVDDVEADAAEAESTTDAETKRRLAALRQDLELSAKECGPRRFNRNPTCGKRVFVIAGPDVALDRNWCSKHGQTHRSALQEELSEDMLDSLITALLNEGYRHIKKHEKGGDAIHGRWISYSVTYFGSER